MRLQDVCKVPTCTELCPLSLFIKALLDYTPTIRLSGKEAHNMDPTIPEHTISSGLNSKTHSSMRLGDKYVIEENGFYRKWLKERKKEQPRL